MKSEFRKICSLKNLCLMRFSSLFILLVLIFLVSACGGDSRQSPQRKENGLGGVGVGNGGEKNGFQATYQSVYGFKVKYNSQLRVVNANDSSLSLDSSILRANGEASTLDLAAVNPSSEIRKSERDLEALVAPYLQTGRAPQKKVDDSGRKSYYLEGTDGKNKLRKWFILGPNRQLLTVDLKLNPSDTEHEDLFEQVVSSLQFDLSPPTVEQLSLEEEDSKQFIHIDVSGLSEREKPKFLIVAEPVGLKARPDWQRRWTSGEKEDEPAPSTELQVVRKSKTKFLIPVKALDLVNGVPYQITMVGVQDASFNWVFLQLPFRIQSPTSYVKQMVPATRMLQEMDPLKAKATEIEILTLTPSF